MASSKRFWSASRCARLLTASCNCGQSLSASSQPVFLLLVGHVAPAVKIGVPEGELAEGEDGVAVDAEVRIGQELLAVGVPEFAVRGDGVGGQLVHRLGVELEDESRRQQVGIHPVDRHALLEVKGVVLLVLLEDFLRDDAVDVEDVVGAGAHDRAAACHALRRRRASARYSSQQSTSSSFAHAGDGHFGIGLVAAQPFLERRPRSGWGGSGDRTGRGYIGVIGIAERVLGDDGDVAAIEGRAALRRFLRVNRPVGLPLVVLLAFDESHEGRHEAARIGSAEVDRVLVHRPHHVGAIIDSRTSGPPGCSRRSCSRAAAARGRARARQSRSRRFVPGPPASVRADRSSAPARRSPSAERKCNATGDERPCTEDCCSKSKPSCGAMISSMKPSRKNDAPRKMNQLTCGQSQRRM